MIRRGGAEYLKRIQRMRDAVTIQTQPTLYLMPEPGLAIITQKYVGSAPDSVVIKIEDSQRNTIMEVSVSMEKFAAMLVGHSSQPAKLWMWREERAGETIPSGTQRKTPPPVAEPARPAATFVSTPEPAATPEPPAEPAAVIDQILSDVAVSEDQDIDERMWMFGG